ncbi:MAG: hypothetical protein OD814_000397 [Candidatus Alkanophagales archaeon MCA70_species_1]|nr:hypothetical protein [Candidatus Alkanophaga volatiphilum]
MPSALWRTLSAVLLIFIFSFLFVTVADASVIKRNFTAEGGYLWFAGALPDCPDDESKKLVVYEGEEIYFVDENGNFVDVIVSGPYEHDGDAKSGCKDYEVQAGEPWDTSGVKTGYFFKVVEKADESIGGWFGIERHSFNIELEKERVQEGESFTLCLKKNNKERGVFKLTIEDDDGFSITNEEGMDVYEILIEYEERNFREFAEGEVAGIDFTADGELVFDTALLKMEDGEYKIILEDCATDADDDVSVEVKPVYLELEVPTEVVRGEDLEIIIRSSFFEHDAAISVTAGALSLYEGVVTLDEDGKKKLRVPTEDAELGRYKVEVSVGGLHRTKYVEVVEGELSVNVPAEATVGDVVAVNGTANFGEYVVILVDERFEDCVRLSVSGAERSFEWSWDTTGEIEGQRRLEFFVVYEPPPFAEGERVSDEWRSEEGVDARASLLLRPPSFELEAPGEVAEGDEVVIRGNATGTSRVFIIILDHRGRIVFPEGGVAHATPVVQGRFEEDVGTLDAGRYHVVAVHAGRDGVTDAIKNGRWNVGGASKSLEQRLEILEDALTAAGSDDLFEEATFVVRSPEVKLHAPASVEVGEPLEAWAETNVKDGEPASFTLSNGSFSLEAITFVEGGRLHVSFNTSGLQPGTYRLAVDVAGRAQDCRNVTLLAPEGTPAGADESVEQEGEKTPGNETQPQPHAAVNAGAGTKAGAGTETGAEAGGESGSESGSGGGGGRSVGGESPPLGGLPRVPAPCVLAPLALVIALVLRRRRR